MLEDVRWNLASPYVFACNHPIEFAVYDPRSPHPPRAA